MAKNNLKILNAIRIGGTVYKGGMEDELQAVLSSEQIKRLLEKGQIAGDFKGAAKAEVIENTEPKGKGK